MDQVSAHPAVTRLAPRRRLAILALIFFMALGVRLLNWHGHRFEVPTVQSSVVLNYKHQARLIQANGLASLYDANSTTSDPDLLGHPLGYPLLLSFVYRIAESDTATQLLQLTLDSLSAVLIALIAFELFPLAVGAIAGLMAALAPQFSWNSILLLPDTLAALPILLAMLLITRTVQRPDNPSERSRLLAIMGAGALIGVSCWLRANALLLAPFLVLLFPGHLQTRRATRSGGGAGRGRLSRDCAADHSQCDGLWQVYSGVAGRRANPHRGHCRLQHRRDSWLAAN